MSITKIVFPAKPRITLVEPAEVIEIINSPTPPYNYKYRVVINCRDTFYVDDDKEVWQVVGSQPFGSGYMVFDRHGVQPYEFIPF